MFAKLNMSIVNNSRVSKASDQFLIEIDNFKKMQERSELDFKYFHNKLMKKSETELTSIANKVLHETLVTIRRIGETTPSHFNNLIISTLADLTHNIPEPINDKNLLCWDLAVFLCFKQNLNKNPALYDNKHPLFNLLFLAKLDLDLE
ncbi:hypothetical protein ACFYKX_25420 [Cytobacillus sp. FJAT-54145]|uniref:Uncharacterized protein n=1 Tax=Cytobacillus spartinae TaxID=3299023 RepID=A0ABW6KID1_9BACI